jgi:hypothetical protein
MVDPVAVLIPLAGGMAVSIAYLVKWASEARTPLKVGTAVFLLLMMAAMLAGGVLYYAHPSAAAFVEAIWATSALMSVSVAVVFVSFVREVRLGASGEAASGFFAGSGVGYLGSVIALVLANELLMGWTFQAAMGQVPVLSSSPLTAVVQVLIASVNSPWFLFTMAAEMVMTAVLLRSRLPRPAFVVLVAQSVLMVLSPPALASATWVTAAVYLSSALMIGLIVYLMEHLYRHPQLGAGFSTYLLELLAVYALMMAGLFLWVFYGDGTAFALSVVLEMIVFFGAVVHPEGFTAKTALPWALRPNWTFGVLALIFVAEIFMGALLDVEVNGSGFTSTLSLLPLSGSPSVAWGNAVTNGFWFFANVAASTWFLVMMGLEMGALVAFKFRETRHRENRIRLGLMMGCYGAFAVFYPSVYLGRVFPNATDPSHVPVLGWPMGFGSFPVATGVFGVLLATYLITGVLVVLFGRRAICSTFCTAPLMFQGTTIDAMKSFNRSGPVGRKYLSSRFSATYSVTMALVMGSLVGSSLLSYLDTTGAVNVTFLGADPAVFFFALYFSVLWYVLFVTIPYVGNYNCVTMGWCYTGIIAQAFQKVGFFKLKVHDKQVCRDCTTLDCAKGCPVALVDMPGHLRTKGEFRSSKCCGVGDCIEACPYDNLYISDVRNWIRARLGRPDRPSAAKRLPMVPPVAARAPSVAPTAPSGLLSVGRP